MTDYQRGFNAGLLAAFRIAEVASSAPADKAVLRSYISEATDARDRMEGRARDRRPMIWDDIALPMRMADAGDFGL